MSVLGPGQKNHLAGERSLYLRQHAGNPLDWYPWGDSAFELARREQRLVLLSIGYSSCYWCHVMEDEVFSRDDVAEFMNAHYVCIKVDREERPDVDAAYMQAAQLMTGGGGWPLNLWLTPDLRPVYAATYLPRHEFLSVSAQIAKAWQEDRAQFESIAGEIVKAVDASRAQSRPGKITHALLDDAAQQILVHTDPQWGGLASRVKFPEPVVWEFLLHHYARTRDEQLRKVLMLTLDRMWDGGLYDHIGGGWHRYSTDREWLVPHFEKMLYDNAQLASLYIDAARVLEEPRYAEIARDTLDFMLGEMQLPDGGFAASFDASTSEGEGAFYVWTPEQLREVAGEDADELARVLGVSDTPNFRDHHGKVSGSVVTRRAVDPRGLFEKYRPALQAERAKRPAPARDEKVVTAWNGLAISALVRGCVMLDEPHYFVLAQLAAATIWHLHRDSDGSLSRTSNAGAAGGPGTLEDYALLANALLDLYTPNTVNSYLNDALGLIDYVANHLACPNGGFYQGNSNLPFARRVWVSDTVEPSGNSVMGHVLLKAALLTGSDEMHNAAGNQLEHFVGNMQASPLESTHCLSAACLWLGPYYIVALCGDHPDAEERLLISTWQRTPTLNSLLALLPYEFDDYFDDYFDNLAPVLQGKRTISNRATAYVCTHGTCSTPVHDPAELRELLLRR